MSAPSSLRARAGKASTAFVAIFFNTSAVTDVSNPTSSFEDAQHKAALVRLANPADGVGQDGGQAVR